MVNNYLLFEIHPHSDEPPRETTCLTLFERRSARISNVMRMIDF